MIRRILVLSGVVMAGYGASLLLPQFGSVLPWLAGGPLIHDLLVAPLIGGLGALAARHRAVTAALAVTGTLLLIAVPLLWRPHPAAPNPGLLDRNYLTGLAVFLGVVWALAALTTLWRCTVRQRHAGRVADHAWLRCIERWQDLGRLDR